VQTSAIPVVGTAAAADGARLATDRWCFVLCGTGSNLPEMFNDL